MATRRMIDSAIFADEWFGALNNYERLLWIGLFATCADDQGRLLDNPALLRAALFPYEDVPLESVERALAAFAEAGKIVRYQASRSRLIQIVRWWENQRPRWAQASKWAPPPGWTDRIRTRENGHYIEINWNPSSTPSYDAPDTSSHDTHDESSYEPTVRTDHTVRQYPDPDPDPDPVPVTTTATAAARAREPEPVDVSPEPERRPERSEFGRLLDAAGVLVGSTMQSQAWQEVEDACRGHPGLLAETFAEMAKSGGGRPTPKWALAIIDRCIAEGRRPGERAQAQPRASPKRETTLDRSRRVLDALIEGGGNGNGDEGSGS